MSSQEVFSYHPPWSEIKHQTVDLAGLDWAAQYIYHRQHFHGFGVGTRVRSYTFIPLIILTYKGFRLHAIAHWLPHQHEYHAFILTSQVWYCKYLCFLTPSPWKHVWSLYLIGFSWIDWITPPCSSEVFHRRRCQCGSGKDSSFKAWQTFSHSVFWWMTTLAI